MLSHPLQTSFRHRPNSKADDAVDATHPRNGRGCGGGRRRRNDSNAGRRARSLALSDLYGAPLLTDAMRPPDRKRCRCPRPDGRIWSGLHSPVRAPAIIEQPFLKNRLRRFLAYFRVLWRSIYTHLTMDWFGAQGGGHKKANKTRTRESEPRTATPECRAR